MKIFLFDVDGVLVRSTGWSKDVEADWGVAPSQLQDFFRADFDDCLHGRRDLADALAPWMARWGHPGRARDFMAYWFAKDAHVDEDVLALARDLTPPEHRFLATNQERLRARHLMDDLGFGRTFAGIFAAWELGAAKPNDAFFRGIAERLSLRYGAPTPLEIHFVDDMAKNVEAARAHGWDAHRFVDAPTLADWLASRA